MDIFPEELLEDSSKKFTEGSLEELPEEFPDDDFLQEISVEFLEGGFPDFKEFTAVFLRNFCKGNFEGIRIFFRGVPDMSYKSIVTTETFEEI